MNYTLQLLIYLNSNHHSQYIQTYHYNHLHIQHQSRVVLQLYHNVL
nr:MAG TPA: hypothetical protein [Caudoviricetes sp.]